MSKRAGDYNQSPRHGKIIKATPSQQQQAYDRLGFIQGGAFLRSQKAQNHMAEQIRKNNGEKKGMDTTINPASAIENGTGNNVNIQVLNLIRTGNGSWNRQGRTVYLKSVRITTQWVIVVKPVVTTADIKIPTVRMMVVWDKQPSGAAIPAFNEIFGRTTQDGVESSLWCDHPKYDNMGRFQLLRDTFINFADHIGIPATGGTTNNVSLSYTTDEYIKLGNRMTIFSGQSSPMTIADISSGALYLIYKQNDVTTGGITSVNISPTDNVSVARLRYTD